MKNWINVCVVAVCVAVPYARAAEFVTNVRAVEFVTAVALDDFRTAQSGGGYMFAYDTAETEASLRVKVKRWLSGDDPDALAMDGPEKRTLYGFYWAATMLPARSKCFVRIKHPACMKELSEWLAKEADGDARFASDYSAAMHPLGLPPLPTDTQP